MSMYCVKEISIEARAASNSFRKEVYVRDQCVHELSVFTLLSKQNKLTEYQQKEICIHTFSSLADTFCFGVIAEGSMFH